MTPKTTEWDGPHVAANSAVVFARDAAAVSEPKVSLPLPAQGWRLRVQHWR